MTPRQTVIVGAGEAGARVAIALREQGFDGAVTLVGEERHAPYERPPLSKGAIFGEEAPAVPFIGDAQRFNELDVDTVFGVAATAIDRAARRLRLSDGDELPYDQLVLATGARPRRLNLPGAEHGLTLRAFEDAVALRERMRPGAAIVVIGGGFIGLELAAGARKRGCEVVVVESAPRVLARATPAPLAAILEARHRAEGVEILTGVGVRGFAAGSVELADGRQLKADAIIVGVGAAPETALAGAAGLALDNGVAVNGRLQTSDPNIYACGDCASFPHPLFDGRRLRPEAWRNAFDQGAFVARALTGADEDFSAVPWFWSDQYDLCLQIAGLPDAGATVATRDLGDGARMTFHLATDGRLVGAGAVGPLGKIAKEVRIAEMLIARRATPSPEELADAKVKLKGLL
jgi:3-phenylpropionate/trans-cinnamate dioxygenase ferredoxin reductase subunit